MSWDPTNPTITLFDDSGTEATQEEIDSSIDDIPETLEEWEDQYADIYKTADTLEVEGWLNEGYRYYIRKGKWKYKKRILFMKYNQIVDYHQEGSQYIIDSRKIVEQSKNMHMYFAAKYHELGVFEELGINFKRIMPYIEKNILKPCNDKTHYELVDHLGKWLIQVDYDLNFELTYGVYREIALLGDSYTPANVGKNFENLNTNTVYLALAAFGLPYAFNQTAKGIKTLLSKGQKEPKEKKKKKTKK